MSKKIAVYGTYEARVPVFQRYWKTTRQRYWKTRVDGVKQRYWKKFKRRYWKKTTRTKKQVGTGRYEFHGKGKLLMKAVKIALRLMPKGYITVSAEEFLRKPYEYGFDGEWVEKPEIKS